MDKNKKVLLFCGIQIAIFLFFLSVLLLHWKTKIQPGQGVIVAFWVVMIFLALIGCALTFVILDYIRDVVRFASADVMGVHNKKALEKKLQELQEKDDTFNLGIMMFDLNDLKKINDTYGHEQGDAFIKTFASFLTRILTDNSFLARFGGDEFVIVEEQTSLEKLKQMNHKLQDMIDDYNQNAQHPLHYAVGYDVSYRNHYYLIPDLMKIADQKMYEDKRYKKQHMQTDGYRPYYYTSGHAHSISSEHLVEKIYTILNNNQGRRKYAFIMSDVQDFRLINDYWGYETGNQILDTVLKRIQTYEGVNFAKRFHSDIFISLLDVTDLQNDEVKKHIQEKNREIQDEILQKFPIRYFMLRTGICIIGDDNTNPEKIISHANTVRRLASDVTDFVLTYGADIEQMELHRADVLNSFQDALTNEDICIYFQPKVGGKSKEIESAEVLVRWEKEPGKIWTPDQFLPELEENGDILELDYYVYEKAFAWLKEREEKGLPVTSLSLNVSPQHFQNINKFEKRVAELREKYKINPELLIFEITENAYIHNSEAVNHMIEKCHQVGIHISMDDFGSGYSSLNTLKDILFDEVKMDKRFLDGQLSTNGKIVIEEIFHLLKRTEHSIVCEGVETKEMADFLIASGCDELQGYYYYKPMPLKQFEQVIA